jgi:hypothetical protein
MKAPCYQCTERTVVCHCNCEEYKAYAEQVKKEREERQAENANRYYPREWDKKYGGGTR